MGGRPLSQEGLLLIQRRFEPEIQLRGGRVRHFHRGPDQVLYFRVQAFIPHNLHPPIFFSSGFCP